MMLNMWSEKAESWLAAHHYPPTVAEIAAGTGKVKSVVPWRPHIYSHLRSVGCAANRRRFSTTTFHRLPFWLRVLEWLLGGNAKGAESATLPSFAQPVTMTLSYSDTATLHLDESQLAIYRWNESGNTWVALPTAVDSTQNQAVAQSTEVGNFDLQAPLLCPADLQEPNDNYCAASLLAPNSTSKSQLLDIEHDEDWFRLDTIASSQYTIQTSNLAPGVDTIIELHDQDGITVLASDDNSGVGAASQLVWQPPLSGVYFVCSPFRLGVVVS